MAIADIDLLLHEQVKSLDSEWLRKVLVSIVGENAEDRRGNQTTVAL